MMAAWYTGRTIFAGSFKPDNLAVYDEAADTAAKLAVNLSNEDVPLGGHPSSDQRLMAVIFGIFRALYERTSLEPLSDDVMYVGAMAMELSEIRPDEDRDAWSYRVCEKIVHVDLAAVGALSLSDESPPMSKESNGGAYQLRYRNTSDRPIRVKLSVQLAATFQDDKPIAPIPAQSKEYVFELQPGAEQLLSGYMEAADTPGVRFALIYPRRRYVNFTLISAQYIAEISSAPSEEKLDESSLRPSARALYSVLPRLTFEAKEKFSHLITGICDVTARRKRCPISINFPGAVSSRLTLSKDGSASIYNTLYDGPSREEARKIMLAVVEDLKSIYPSVRLGMSRPMLN
jgi:hypothetical protein